MAPRHPKNHLIIPRSSQQYKLLILQYAIEGKCGKSDTKITSCGTYTSVKRRVCGKDTIEDVGPFSRFNFLSSSTSHEIHCAAFESLKTTNEKGYLDFRALSSSN